MAQNMRKLVIEPSQTTSVDEQLCFVHVSQMAEHALRQTTGVVLVALPLTL
jgi:hypothetical protein